MSFRIISDEITPWLAEVSEKLTDDQWWLRAIRPEMGGLQRFAAEISPVVTGSYAGSHRLAVEGRVVELSIDPAARNISTGGLVARYAHPVEERHQVYGQVWARTGGAAERALEVLAKDLGL